MSISEGKACRAVVAGCRQIHPGGLLRAPERAVIDAPRVLFQENPSVGRAGDVELRSLADLLVNRTAWTFRGITIPNTGVPRVTSRPVGPTPAHLSGSQC